MMILDINIDIKSNKVFIDFVFHFTTFIKYIVGSYVLKVVLLSKSGMKVLTQTSIRTVVIGQLQN